MFKNANKGYIALAALLVAFNVAAFTAPFTKTAAFWIAYGFGTFAILFQLYIYRFALAGDKTAKSRFFGFSIARLGVYCLVAQLAASYIEMAFAESFPPRAALIFNAVIAALMIAGCIPANATKAGNARPDGGASGMDELQAMARMMVGLCQDDALKSAMQALADAIGNGPASPDAALETDTRNRLGDIQQAIVDGDADRAKALCEALTGRLKARD